ncbi:HpcH/HpaI aldolase family protein [Caldinitratiruptor microaerophilus]|uniref:2,4-dihydroxyhept-2-ene-1,7-dioic acid aldolase n=1 Tax=Caldinitratiruptor microaerophilus TaxID=671077 RepID=A0AA35CR48_9FIRM|nr:aldolase/citrate lyase family protein [Caldinitratiruptor microaerophilus]BDG62275.1 2,4-dihydroxyhept-2-ene-1,7-dioic acid aldolase [Caldinitratiruptor microaerophilus]
METNRVKRQLQVGTPSIGTWLTVPSPFVAETLAAAGFDWLTVDMEHSPFDWHTAALMFMAVRSQGGVPLVRIPWNTGENIKRALDYGAWGIVVPMVNSREEAEAAVAGAKYPPQGIRSVGGARHALSFAAKPAEYFARANDEILVVLQIEHIRAVENVDAIVSVPGVDAVFIGPNDLAASMGLPPGYERDEPQVVQAIRHVRERAAAHGVAAGIHCSDGAAVARRVEEGFRLLALGSDGRLLTQAAVEQLRRARREPV